MSRHAPRRGRCNSACASSYQFCACISTEPFPSLSSAMALVNLVLQVTDEGSLSCLEYARGYLDQAAYCLPCNMDGATHIYRKPKG